MTLVCRTYGGPEEGVGADAVAVLVTPQFLEGLRVRQGLVRGIVQRHGALGIDSVLFHGCHLIWFPWIEKLEDVLGAAEAEGWTLTARDIPATHRVPVDGKFLQIWPDRFRYRCHLRNTVFAIESAVVRFEDLFATAARVLPAAHPGSSTTKHTNLPVADAFRP